MCQKPIIVTDENIFDVVTRHDGPLVLIVGTQWCKDTARLIEEALPLVMNKFGQRVKFAHLNLEEAVERRKVNPLAHSALNIQRYPTIIAYKDGKEVSRRSSEGEVDDQIRDLMEIASSLIK